VGNHLPEAARPDQSAVCAAVAACGEASSLSMLTLHFQCSSCFLCSLTIKLHLFPTGIFDLLKRTIAGPSLYLRKLLAMQVNPDVKRRVPWTDEEDEKLRALINKARAKRQAISWADIARKLPGRSDQQVKGHWER